MQVTYKAFTSVAKVCDKRQVSKGVRSIYAAVAVSGFLHVIYRSRSAGKYPLYWFLLVLFSTTVIMRYVCVMYMSVLLGRSPKW